MAITSVCDLTAGEPAPKKRWPFLSLPNFRVRRYLQFKELEVVATTSGLVFAIRMCRIGLSASRSVFF